MTATPVDAIPVITRAEVESLAATEYARLADQLRSLNEDDWTKPTVCDLWDVRAMAGHNLAMMVDFTSFKRLMGRMSAAGKAAKASGVELIDAMTAGQVADTASLSNDELIRRTDETGPRAARWRGKAPWLFRKMPMKEKVGGKPETWRMGYLLHVILTRDPWMHRTDIAAATGHTLVLTPEHDGRIVADVVAEWARRHEQPFSLTLGGPAGGDFVVGEGGERIEMDAVEFCRVLSGRGSRPGLLAQEVPF
ncbi:MAG: maleylpyruvate isomerase family mycothiol-dependent enzyme [Aquihabitans sp.]